MLSKWTHLRKWKSCSNLTWQPKKQSPLWEKFGIMMNGNISMITCILGVEAFPSFILFFPCFHFFFYFVNKFICIMSKAIYIFKSFSIKSEITQFGTVTQSCPTLCKPMDCSTPALPVHHQLLEIRGKIMESNSEIKSINTISYLFLMDYMWWKKS